MFFFPSIAVYYKTATLRLLITDTLLFGLNATALIEIIIIYINKKFKCENGFCHSYTV